MDGSKTDVRMLNERSPEKANGIHIPCSNQGTSLWIPCWCSGKMVAVLFSVKRWKSRQGGTPSYIAK
jgi:hypothetical protein